jgi:hypothetical protein
LRAFYSPPDCYVVVVDPHEKDAQGRPVHDEYGQVVLRLGREEVRLNCEPFPLYPGETLKGAGKPLPLPQVNSSWSAYDIDV